MFTCSVCYTLQTHFHTQEVAAAELSVVCFAFILLFVMNRRLVHKYGNIVVEDETKGDEKSFSVMQWNILAQTLAQNGMFQFATKDVLDWQHRKELIVKVNKSSAKCYLILLDTLFNLLLLHCRKYWSTIQILDVLKKLIAFIYWKRICIPMVIRDFLSPNQHPLV